MMMMIMSDISQNIKGYVLVLRYLAHLKIALHGTVFVTAYLLPTKTELQNFHLSLGRQKCPWHGSFSANYVMYKIVCFMQFAQIAVAWAFKIRGAEWHLCIQPVLVSMLYFSNRKATRSSLTNRDILCNSQTCW